MNRKLIFRPYQILFMGLLFTLAVESLLPLRMDSYCPDMLWLQLCVLALQAKWRDAVLFSLILGFARDWLSGPLLGPSLLFFLFCSLFLLWLRDKEALIFHRFIFLLLGLSLFYDLYGQILPAILGLWPYDLKEAILASLRIWPRLLILNLLLGTVLYFLYGQFCPLYEARSREREETLLGERRGDIL